MYKLRMPDRIAELVRHMHPQLKRKLKISLQAILSEPNLGKALKEELVGLRSVRVSRFRIIYRIIGKKEIEIITIGPRQRIYEETFRIVKLKCCPKFYLLHNFCELNYIIIWFIFNNPLRNYFQIFL